MGEHLVFFLKVVSGFHTEGGSWNPSPPPPRNLEIEYGYYCFVTGIKQQSCPRLRQKQSERIDLNSKFSSVACPQTPVVGTHTYVCVSVLSRTTIILLPPCFTPPNSKSCMKPWVCSSLIIKTTPLFCSPSEGTQLVPWSCTTRVSSSLDPWWRCPRPT